MGGAADSVMDMGADVLLTDQNLTDSIGLVNEVVGNESATTDIYGCRRKVP